MSSLRFRQFGIVVILPAALYAQSLPTPRSLIRTFAGTEFTWQNEGKLAVNAPIGSPQDVNLDAAGNVYYADLFGQAYRVSPDGRVQLRGFPPRRAPW